MNILHRLMLIAWARKHHFQVLNCWKRVTWSDNVYSKCFYWWTDWCRQLWKSPQKVLDTTYQEEDVEVNGSSAMVWDLFIYLFTVFKLHTKSLSQSIAMCSSLFLSCTHSFSVFNLMDFSQRLSHYTSLKRSNYQLETKSLETGVLAFPPMSGDMNVIEHTRDTIQ